MLNFKSFMITALALTLLMISTALPAATITFDVNDFMISTTTTSGTNLSSLPTSAPGLPADGTFTLSPTGNLSLSPSEGKFLRFDFLLPTGYYNLAFSFDALVDDEFALYLNDTVVAMQSDTSTVNFNTPLPGFSMDTAGAATDTSGGKLDYLLASGIQPLFQPGANELTLYGTDTVVGGSIASIDGMISYEIDDTLPPNGVPEPVTAILLGCGLIGLAGFRRTA